MGDSRPPERFRPPASRAPERHSTFSTPLRSASMSARGHPVVERADVSVRRYGSQRPRRARGRQSRVQVRKMPAETTARTRDGARRRDAAARRGRERCRNDEQWIDQARLLRSRTVWTDERRPPEARQACAQARERVADAPTVGSVEHTGARSACALNLGDDVLAEPLRSAGGGAVSDDIRLRCVPAEGAGAAARQISDSQARANAIAALGEGEQTAWRSLV